MTVLSIEVFIDQLSDATVLISGQSQSVDYSFDSADQ